MPASAPPPSLLHSEYLLRDAHAKQDSARLRELLGLAEAIGVHVSRDWSLRADLLALKPTSSDHQFAKVAQRGLLLLLSLDPPSNP